MNKQKNDSSTENKRYVYVQRDGDDFSSIKIVEGKYKDVIYKYGKVQFANEEQPDAIFLCSFNGLYKSKSEELDLYIDQPAFIKYIGDILVEILDEKIKDGTILDDK